MSEQRIVYKICPMNAWSEAVGRGQYLGSDEDVRDGFIHLSAPQQVRGTAERHYRGQTDLALVALDAGRLGPALRWEPSRGGQLFPHVYGPLDVAAALSVRPLALGAHGIPVIPEDVA